MHAWTTFYMLIINMIKKRIVSVLNKNLCDIHTHTHTKHIQKQYKFLLAHFCLSNKFWNVSHLFGKFSSSLSRKETIFGESYIHLITFIIPKTSSIYTKYFTVRYFQLWQLSFKIYLILHVKIILIIIMMIKIKENFVACFL